MTDERHSRLTRRQLLFGLAGLGATYATYKFSLSPESRLQLVAGENLFDTAGAPLLDYSVDTVFDRFCRARFGGLTYLYQNFWQLQRTPGAIDALDHLCKEASMRISQGTLKDVDLMASRHRIVALPAVARIHALSISDSQSEQHQIDVLSVHAAALDPREVSGNREVLEIIWQNATATVIANADNWRGTWFGTDLVSEAAKVCQSFLAGQLNLFHPAIAAWQFLHTYERALARRDAAEREHELNYVRQSIHEVLSHPLALRSYWFRQLASIYAERRELSEMLPQMNEIVVGQSRLPPEIKDFFLRVRVQNTHIGGLVREGLIPPTYIPPHRRDSIGTRSFAIFANYGVSQEDWNRLKKIELNDDPRLSVSSDAFRYWEADRTSEAATGFESADRGTAPVFRALFPFSSGDTQRAAQEALGDETDLSELFHSIPRRASQMAKLNALWDKPFHAEARRLTAAFALTGSAARFSLDLEEADSNLTQSHASLLEAFLEDTGIRQWSMPAGHFGGASRVPVWEAPRSMEQAESGQRVSEDAGNFVPKDRVKRSGLVWPIERRRDLTSGVSTAGGHLEMLSSAGTSVDPPAMEDQVDPEFLWSMPHVVLIPDFNQIPFDGKTPDELRTLFGVEARVLARSSPDTTPHGVVIAGTATAVNACLKHLRSTWPTH